MRNLQRSQKNNKQCVAKYVCSWEPGVWELDNGRFTIFLHTELYVFTIYLMLFQTYKQKKYHFENLGSKMFFLQLCTMSNMLFPLLKKASEPSVSAS